VPYFHVKDRKKVFPFRTGSAIFGEGYIPWKQVLPWFAEKGFNGYLSIEPHVHGENRFEKGRQCAKNLQNLLSELHIPFE
jgi:sugar phosphate isomerase/epimerase